MNIIAKWWGMLFFEITQTVDQWHHADGYYYYTCGVVHYDHSIKARRSFGVEKGKDGIWRYYWNKEPVSKRIARHLDKTPLTTDYHDRW